MRSKKNIWDFLLDHSRIQCTWDNFVAYYEQYGSVSTWAEYFDRNIDTLLNDIDNEVVTEEVLSALMFADITEDSFRKYVLRVKPNPYKESLTKLNKMKVKVMIENSLLPYNVSFWDEMESVAPEYRVFYAEANKVAFISLLDDVEIKDEEINSLLQSSLFFPSEKQNILSKLDVEALGVETAKIISELPFKIDRIYTDAAWNILDGNDKYALLLNQIDAYENEELPDLFAELALVYHQLVERTRHKFKFTYTDYNKALLDKLLQKGYIAKADEEWIEKEDHILFSRDKEHVITGYVKQI